MKNIIEEFNEVVKRVEESATFQEFERQHHNYYLVNGFTQLDAVKQPIKKWQVCYFNEEQDHLAVFDVEPKVALQSFQEAVKFSGSIPELTPLPKISTEEALATVEKQLVKDHPHQIIRTYLVVVQAIKEETVYNITVVTMNFAMLTFHIHGQTGKIIHTQHGSVMDLKQNLKGDAE